MELQTDTDGNQFVINNIYEIEDDKFIYLGHGIEDAISNPNFFGNRLGPMYKNKFIFQSVTNPRIKMSINIDSTDNDGLLIKSLIKTRKYENGRYEGFLDVNNEPHGHGIMLYDDGTTMEGEWNHGEKIIGKMKYWKETDGIETMTYANGDVYKGKWKDKNNGTGTITYANGDVYEGEWKYEKKYGIGKLTKYVDDPVFYQMYEEYVYDGNWKEDKKYGRGKLTIHDVDMVCTWDNNMITTFIQINTDKQISIASMLPFIDSDTTFSSRFYMLVGLSQPKIIVDEFLERMKTYTGTVLVAAICHAALLPPIQLPIKKIHRISKVVNGVCGFSDINIKLNLIDSVVSNPISNIVPIVQAQFMQTTKYYCNSKVCSNQEYDTMVRHVSGLTKSPEKITTEDNPILNKIFSSIGTNINILLLIDNEGNYINLLSNIDTITLEKVFRIIPECSKCIFVDSSCSAPYIKNINDKRYYAFTKDELENYGGTRKTYKKTKKTKKTKKYK